MAQVNARAGRKELPVTSERRWKREEQVGPLFWPQPPSRQGSRVQLHLLGFTFCWKTEQSGEKNSFSSDCYFPSNLLPMNWGEGEVVVDSCKTRRNQQLLRVQLCCFQDLSQQVSTFL